MNDAAWEHGNFVPETYVLPQAVLDSEELIPTVKGKMFEPTVVCCKCRAPFKVYDTVNFRGKHYGIPCGCSKDIEKLVNGGS